MYIEGYCNGSEVNMIFQMTARKVFGVKYERLRRSFLIWGIVFGGLRAAEVRVDIAPFLLCLMSGSFTAGVMWLALSAEDNRDNMRNLFMTPFRKKELNASYVSALGFYTLATKTLGLLSVMWAVSNWSVMEILGSVLCAVNAVWMCACVYAWHNSLCFGLCRGFLWCGVALVMLFAMGWGGTVQMCGFAALLGNTALSCLMTLHVDSYAFYENAGSGAPFLGSPAGGLARTVRNISGCNGAIRYGRTGRKRLWTGTASGLVWRYLLRYMASHGNYLFNTVIMWGVACVLPVLLGQVGGMAGGVPGAASKSSFLLPIGFAIVSMNTPICILLSCDPSSEQAVRFLPGQKRAFFLPYGIFLFLCNMTAETIYLCSWQFLFGDMPGRAVPAAVCFAFLGAAGSVLLEWFCPIRGWKIESDLWHHPRKYIVPGVLLLLAAACGAIF